MDKTRKLWLMYPPTHHNLELFSRVVGGNHFSLLGRIGLELEGGIVAVTCNEDIDIGNHLIIPEGTIHAVLTLQGGVLGGTNWGTAQGLPLAAENATAANRSNAVARPTRRRLDVVYERLQEYR